MWRIRSRGGTRLLKSLECRIVIICFQFEHTGLESARLARHRAQLKERDGDEVQTRSRGVTERVWAVTSRPKLGSAAIRVSCHHLLAYDLSSTARDESTPASRFGYIQKSEMLGRDWPVFETPPGEVRAACGGDAPARGTLPLADRNVRRPTDGGRRASGRDERGLRYT
jgi:hypothetical protein